MNNTTTGCQKRQSTTEMPIDDAATSSAKNKRKLCCQQGVLMLQILSMFRASAAKLTHTLQGNVLFLCSLPDMVNTILLLLLLLLLLFSNQFL